MTVYLLNLFSIPLYALLFYFAGIDNRKKNRILCGLAGLQLFLTAACGRRRWEGIWRIIFLLFDYFPNTLERIVDVSLGVWLCSFE